MYQILIDGRDLYYPQDEEYTASDPVVKLQLNDSGTLDLGVPVCNPEYDKPHFYGTGVEKWKRDFLRGSAGSGKGFLQNETSLRSR